MTAGFDLSLGLASAGLVRQHRTSPGGATDELGGGDADSIHSLIVPVSVFCTSSDTPVSLALHTVWPFASIGESRISTLPGLNFY